MTKKFIVALDSGTRAQQNTITHLLESTDWKIWHWIEDLWLISKAPQDVTCQHISEMIDKVHPNPPLTVLVLEVGDKQVYWGRANPNAWPWLNENWGSTS